MMRRTASKLLSIVLVFSITLGLFPSIVPTAMAATNLAGSFEGQDADVFSALGFDTEQIPEGYDEETTDNPYGRDKLAGNQVFELLVSSAKGKNIYGKDNNSVSAGSISGQPSGSGSGLEMFAVAAGDFDGDGLPGEAVYVGFEQIKYCADTLQVTTKKAMGDTELVMKIYSGQTDDYSADKKSLGNVSAYNTASDETVRLYQGVTDAYWQNLLQVAAGDFDGDGYSEIAVYVAENGKARVDIYKYQRTSNSGEKDWMTLANWSCVWSYALSGQQNAVPNMVSLCAGDFNRDGVDDLAVASGRVVFSEFENYPGFIQELHDYEKSSAVLLWGGKSDMLQQSAALDLNEAELGEQVRVSLTAGDLDGDGSKELIATGQPLSDIKNYTWNSATSEGNQKRTVTTYLYDADLGMTVNESSLLEPVAGEMVTMTSELNEDGTVKTSSQKWQSENGFDGYYYSLPAMRTNAAVFQPVGYDNCFLYLDSCLYEYQQGKLSLKMEMDESKYDGENALNTHWGVRAGKVNSSSSYYYMEYGAVSGDVNGEGYDILGTSYYGVASQGSMATVENETMITIHSGWTAYNILYGTGSGALAATHTQPTTNLETGEAYIDGDFAPVYMVMLDVDMDTVLIEYSGIHYLTYSDPKVLAIIAAAPYFEDVDIISDYDYAWQNTTSYSQIKGEGSSDIVSVDFSIGGYLSADTTIHGVEVELETSVGYTLSYEKEMTKSTEYELSFETSQDEDAVAFFSIPTENYVYYIYTPDGNGGYTKTVDTISNTFTPCYQVLTLEYYESIQGNYAELPQISGVALTSTPGDPSSYPSSTSGYDVIASWDDYPAGVSFGNGAITQTITVTEEEAETYVMGAQWDFKLGGGGKFQSDLFQSELEMSGGVQWSLNPAGGWSNINLTGTSFSGTVTNMPLEFQDYGYYYSWSLFAYNYKFDDGTSIPVVSYVVGDVSQPPELPEDFQQDFARSTSDSNVLTWTYDDTVSNFYIYKYYDFPEGGGLEKVATIQPGDSNHYTLKYDDDGKPYKEYYFTDENLTPYTEYSYAIQVERLSPVPPLSSPSGLLTVRTKAADGYPSLSIAESDGKADGNLLVYPDKNAYLTAAVRGPDGETSANYYTTVQFQWQKLENGAWTDIVNETNETLTFANAGVDSAGDYRCRVNVQAKTTGTYISAYTDAVTLTHSKRTSYIEEETMSVSDVSGGGLELYAKVCNAHSDSAAVPGGTVTFNLTNSATGTTYQYFVALDAAGVATKVLNDSSVLPEGMYSVYAYYGGSYTFKASAAEGIYLSQMSSGYTIDLPASITYGDAAELCFQKVSKQGGVTSTAEEKPSTSKLYLADPLQQGTVSGAAYYSGRDGAIAGAIYNYLDTDGVAWHFTASCTGTRYTFKNGYAIFGDEVTDCLSYANDSDAEGLYTLTAGTPAGSYLVEMQSDTGVTARVSLTVDRRSVTLQLPTQKGSVGTDVVKPKPGELTVVSGNWADCDLENGVLKSSVNIDLNTEYYNTAGTKFDNTTVDTTCGFYTIRCTDSIANYDLHFLDGSVTILGAAHAVTVGARPFEEQAVGTLYAISPEYGSTRADAAASADVLTLNQQTGTRLVFTAVPDAGYEVYDWYINGESMGTTATSLAYVLLNEDTKVEVQFAIKQNTLTFDTAGDLGGGSLSCDDESLTSGSVILANSRFVFTAQAKEGYHFKEWRYTEQGAGTIYDSEDAGKMESSYELYMPTGSCSLYAVFERDFYTLTYTDESGNDGLTAWYMGNNGDSTAAQEKIEISSGEQVKGGTTVTMSLRPGCAWDAEYLYVATGSQGVADYAEGTYTFTLEQDTAVSGYTKRDSYNLTLVFDVTKAENDDKVPVDAQIIYTVNGEEYTFDYTADKTSLEIEDIPGGATVSAQIVWPEYYDMLGWTAAGTELTASATVNRLAVELKDGGAVTKDTAYYYTDSDGAVWYFTAPVSGTAKFVKDAVTVYASAPIYAVAELSADETFTVHLMEKARYTTTLTSLTADDKTKGIYSYELPAGAFENEDKTAITVHDGDNLTVTVTPSQGYAVSYWEVTPEGGTKQTTRATSVKYTIPNIQNNYTFTPVFSSTTYNTISWPGISSSQNGLTLSPESGYLSSVASGKDFKFKLSGGGLTLLDEVRTNGTVLTAGSDGVYTISNITENQVITVTLKEVGVTVNGTDISAISGAGWSYDTDSQILALSRGNLTLSGSNDTAVAPNLSIEVGTTAASLVLDDLTLNSSGTSGLLYIRGADVVLTLTGINSIQDMKANSAGSGIVRATGSLTLRGNGQLTVDNEGDIYSMAVNVTGDLLMAGNARLTVSGGSHDCAVRVDGTVTVGAQNSTAAPALHISNSKSANNQAGGSGLFVKDQLNVYSGELCVDAEVGHAVTCNQVHNYGGVMELCSGTDGYDVLHTTVDVYEWYAYYANGYMARVGEDSTADRDAYTVAASDYGKTNEYDILAFSSPSSSQGSSTISRLLYLIYQSMSGEYAQKLNTYNYVRLEPIAQSDDSESDSVTITVTVPGSLLTNTADKKYSTTLATLNQNIGNYAYIDLDETVAAGKTGTIKFASNGTLARQTSIPNWLFLTDVLTGSSAAVIQFKSYHVTWTPVYPTEAPPGQTLDSLPADYYRAATNEDGSLQTSLGTSLIWELSGGAVVKSGTAGGLDFSDRTVESLTLKNLTYTSLVVNGSTVYLEGENYLISSKHVPLSASAGTDVTLKGKGSLTLSTGKANSDGPALKADYLNLWGVKSLTLLANGSALKGASTEADTSTLKNCQSVTYYDADAAKTSIDTREKLDYGQGWLQDNGASAGSAVTETKNVNLNTGEYVRFYAATTDAAATPGAFSYDKGTKTGVYAATLKSPAVLGELHRFTANETSCRVALLHNDSEETIDAVNYSWNEGNQKLSMKDTWLQTLETGSYTLRVYFRDEDPSDATYYYLDIPLTITNDSVQSGDLTMTPSGSDLKLGRGKSMTFTAKQTGATTPAAYVWTVNDEPQSATGSTFTLAVDENAELDTAYTVQVTAYADAEKQVPLGMANATVTVTASAKDIAISCVGETPSGDGNYILYHNTGSGTAKTWDFDAEVSMDDNSTSNTVKWSLWGATRQTTQVDADSGELTINPSETGTGGLLKLTATYTNADGSVLKENVLIRLSTDAYVEYDGSQDSKGQISGAVYGVSQTAVAADGQWIPANNQVVVTATPAEGCTVKTWYVNDVSVMENTAYTVDAENQTLTFTTEKMQHYAIRAEFANADSYTVTYSAAENGSLSAVSAGAALSSGSQLVKGEDVVFTAHPDANCRVDHWTVDGEIYKESDAVYTGNTLTLENIEADHSVTVSFIGEEITISFLAGPTDSAAPKGSLSLLVNGQKVDVTPTTNDDKSLSYTATVHAMDDVVILANPDSGYLVGSWLLKNGSKYDNIADSSGKTTYTVEDIRSGFTVKTEFTAIPSHTVTVHVNSYQNGAGAVQGGLTTVPMSDTGTFTVKQHDNLTLLALPDTGCYLYEWQVTGATFSQDGDAVTLTDVTGDVTVNAFFRRSFYDVTLETEGSGTLSGSYALTIDKDSFNGDLTDSKTSVRGGSTINLTVKADVGSILSSLTVDGKTVQPTWDDTAKRYTYSIPALTENLQIKALFTDATSLFDVTAPAAFSVVTDASTEPVTTETSGTATADYVPDGISGDQDKNDCKVEIAEGGAAKLSFQAESGYSVDGTALQAAVKKVLEAAESKAKYSVSLSGEKYIVLLEDVDMALDFSGMDSPFVALDAETAQYTVNYTAGTNGSLLVMAGETRILSGATIPAGTQLQITATPDAHYAVNSLKNGSTDIEPTVADDGSWTASLTVDAETNLEAAFAVSEYEIEVTMLGTGSGSVTINNVNYATGVYYLPAEEPLNIQIEPDSNSKLSQQSIRIGDTDAQSPYILSANMQIKAVFEAETCVVTYNTPEHGTLTVLDGSGQKVENGQSVAVGTTLIVIPVPDAHYKLSTMTAGGTAHTPDSGYIVNADKTNHIECEFAVAEVPVTWGAENGSINVSLMPDGDALQNGQYVPVGACLKITTTAAKDYSLQSLDVDGAVQGATNGLYTVGSQPVEITASFDYSSGGTATGNFVDVPIGSYCYDAIHWAAENGVTKGVDVRHFAPNEPCTRAQIVTFLWRAAGSPEPRNLNSFTDVAANSYYAKAVAWAVEKGITKGTGDGKFSPNSTCTRAQAVTFCYRASGSPAVSGSTGFDDVPDNAYYADAVKWAEAEGITKGTSFNTFSPNSTCTRAQIVTFLWRALGK